MGLMSRAVSASFSTPFITIGGVLIAAEVDAKRAIKEAVECAIRF